MVLEVIRYRMAATVLALFETVELDLCLMKDNRGVLSNLEYVAHLLNHSEKAEGVTGKIERIEVGLILYLASEVLVATPQDSRKYLAQAGGVASILGHHLACPQ